MPLSVGQWRSLSRPRRFITDLMHFSQQVPTVTAERRMSLGALVAARRACQNRPSWCVLFARAFALVAARRPELRCSYLSFPWPHLYEHPVSVAAITVERTWDGEETPIIAHLVSPETRSLTDLDARLRYFQVCPLNEISAIRRAERMLRLPRPLRRLVFWAALNLNGPARARYIGTYGVSSPAIHGAGMLHLRSPATCTLHYGQFNSDSSLDVRLTFDHRVLDGGTAARALTDLENVLLHQILTEVRAIGDAQAT